MFLVIEEYKNIVGIFTGVFSINKMLREHYDTDKYFIDHAYIKDINGQSIVTNDGLHLAIKYFRINTIVR